MENFNYNEINKRQVAPNLLKSYGIDIEKAEGSRGGKVIGHTQSGKPIYENPSHSAHKNFTAQDHRDAALHHDTLRLQHMGASYVWQTSSHDENSEHGKLAKKHAIANREHKEAAARLDKESAVKKGEDIEKAEGGRGGKVIGHTKSGKPIYAIRGGSQGAVVDWRHATEKEGYSKQDHLDAIEFHEKENVRKKGVGYHRVQVIEHKDWLSKEPAVKKGESDDVEKGGQGSGRHSSQLSSGQKQAILNLASDHVSRSSLKHYIGNDYHFHNDNGRLKITNKEGKVSYHGASNSGDVLKEDSTKELEKGGMGSGKHKSWTTTSGKKIHAEANHPDHKNFTREDHIEAKELHEGIAQHPLSNEKEKKHHLKQAEEHRSAAVEAGRRRLEKGQQDKDDDSLKNYDNIYASADEAGKEKMKKVMDEWKAGKLKTSAGKEVTDHKQAVAIALNEAGLSKAEIDEISKGGVGSGRRDHVSVTSVGPWSGSLLGSGHGKIGETRSGKGIDNYADHSWHEKFSKEDHEDAIAAHEHIKSQLGKLDKQSYGSDAEKRGVAYHNEQIKWHKDKISGIQKAISAGSATGTETTNKPSTGDALKKEDIEKGGRGSGRKVTIKDYSGKKKEVIFHHTDEQGFHHIEDPETGKRGIYRGKLEKGETMTVDTKEMIDEHKKLINTLESPSHKDDKKEAKKQKKELGEYEEKLKKSYEVLGL